MLFKPGIGLAGVVLALSLMTVSGSTLADDGKLSCKPARDCRGKPTNCVGPATCVECSNGMGVRIKRWECKGVRIKPSLPGPREREKSDVPVPPDDPAPPNDPGDPDEQPGDNDKGTIIEEPPPPPEDSTVKIIVAIIGAVGVIGAAAIAAKKR